MNNGTVLEVRHLKKYFVKSAGILSALLGEKKRYVSAVEDVSFNISKGEIFCVAGESGCGKTTLGRTIPMKPWPGSIDCSGLNESSETRISLPRYSCNAGGKRSHRSWRTCGRGLKVGSLRFPPRRCWEKPSGPRSKIGPNCWAIWTVHS